MRTIGGLEREIVFLPPCEDFGQRHVAENKARRGRGPSLTVTHSRVLLCENARFRIFSKSSAPMGSPIEVVSSLSTKENRLSSALPRWQTTALLLLTAWLYATILARLFLQWIHDPNFSHGIFVPAFALFVLWQDRRKLQRIPQASSWTGIPLVYLSMLMLVLGELGAELFSSRTSLLVLICGLILLFKGWAFFRAVLFSWAILFLAIPPPTLILQRVTFPLQLLASKVATTMLQLVGVPVFRLGNVIKLPAKELYVAEACSGIRSLLTLVTLAIIYGYLMETRMRVRVALVCLAVPIAVVANSCRVFTTGLLVQYWDPDKAMGFYHTFEGWLIFVVALIMLFAAHRLILLIWKSDSDAPRGRADVAGQRAGELGTKAGTLRFSLVALPILATAIGLQARPHSEVFPARAPLSSLPSQIDGWTGTDDVLDQQTLEILGHPEYVLREYKDGSQPQSAIALFIAYYPTQKTGDTIHSPDHCLPGQGWVPTSTEVVQIRQPDGSSFPANRLVGSQSGDPPELVLYWYQAHGRALASGYAAKYYLIADSIRMNRSDGALVRLSIPLLEGETPDAAQARMMKLGSQILSMLDNYIPR